MQQVPPRATFDVIVSGASYAGLSLGLALAEALPGITIALVDPAAPQGTGTPWRDPRAFAVSASSRHLLEAIGIWPAIAAEAQAVSSIEITDSELDAGVRPTLLTYTNDTDAGEPASHIVPGGALLAALVDKARTTADLSIVTPHAAATGYTAGEIDAVVSLADGREIAGRLVVAAEGRRSSLREAAGIKLVGWPYHQTGIVVTVAHERPHLGLAVQHFLPSGPFAILPLPGDRSCITWTEEAREARRILALDDAAFLGEVEKRFGGRLGTVSLASRPASWPLELHLARAYVAPRLALVGDTAHGVHPIAGQGLNLALRDVAALAEVVAETMRVGLDPGSPDVLARYERWRRFDSTVSALAFDGINRLFSNDWTLLRAARDFGLGVVDRMPLVKRMLVSEAAGLTGDVPRLLKGERV